MFNTPKRVWACLRVPRQLKRHSKGYVSKDIADELAKALEYADSALFMRGVLRTGTIRTRIHLALAKYKETDDA